VGIGVSVLVSQLVRHMTGIELGILGHIDELVFQLV
jgi:hypothetical protein